MNQQQPAAEDRIRSAVTSLISVFEALGPEHQALVSEQDRTSARERRGTVVRMVSGVDEAARTIAGAIKELATLYGLRALSIDRQLSKDSEGSDHTPLGSLASPAETVYEVVMRLCEVANGLEAAYAPTKKHPALATARCPAHMGVALSNLRAALETVRAEAGDDHEAVEDCAEAQRLLADLEKRICRPVPAQGAGPSADEVAAAIRADPEVARAAAAALAQERPRQRGKADHHG